MQPVGESLLTVGLKVTCWKIGEDIWLGSCYSLRAALWPTSQAHVDAMTGFQP
jgi:hypothetical protein